MLQQKSSEFHKNTISHRISALIIWTLTIHSIWSADMIRGRLCTEYISPVTTRPLCSSYCFTSHLEILHHVLPASASIGWRGGVLLPCLWILRLSWFVYEMTANLWMEYCSNINISCDPWLSQFYFHLFFTNKNNDTNQLSGGWNIWTITVLIVILSYLAWYWLWHLSSLRSYPSL